MPRVKLFDEEEVLAKAMELFCKQGYAATSVQDLVCHLGINRASLYDTYGDKEKLFKKAFQHYRKDSIERVKHFILSEPDVKEGFKNLFEIAIDQSVNDKERKGCFVVNTTTELVPGNDNILKLLEENKRNYETLFYEYLKKGEEKGQVKTGKDLKSIASLLFTLYSGLKVVGKVSPDKKEQMTSVNMVLSLLD